MIDRKELDLKGGLYGGKVWTSLLMSVAERMPGKEQ